MNEFVPVQNVDPALLQARLYHLGLHMFIVHVICCSHWLPLSNM